MLQLPDDSWRGVAQRNKIPGPASLLGTRKTRFQQNSTSENNIDCRRTRLQIDCDLFGLEGYQGQIKVLHFALQFRPAKNPQKNPQIFSGDMKDLAGSNSAADCLLH
jgi:hypothetical protein